MKLPGIASFLILTVFFLFPAISLVAQSSADDSVLYQKAINNLVSLYHQSEGDQTGLYNGSQYGGFPFTFKEGHPFFYDGKPGTGSIVYEDVLYENVLLQYDEIQEAVVMEDSSRRIQLLNERIRQFSVFNNAFIRIVKDSLSNALVKTGYYNLLYEGRNRLLKKEIKTVREDITTEKVIYYVDLHEYYYIKKDNTYYAVNSKRNVLKIFGDRKKEVQQYIRKNKLSYRKDRDNMLIKVTAYYDQLIK